VLAESYAELPLQVQRPRAGPCGQSIVTLLTPGGSLLDGDAVDLYIDVRPGARVLLRQASATQLHGGGEVGIRFDATISVGAGASFSYLPFELIPFADSDYRQSLRLFLEHGAEAVLTEVVTPGRLWEHFGYRRLELRTEVHLDGRRILLDAQRIVPAEADVESLLAGRSHFGSVLQFGPGIDREEADCLHARLAEVDILGSASVLPSYGVGARALGTSADQLLRAFIPL
jgi:urease accessory protein UreH